MSAVFAGDDENQFVHFSLAWLRRVTRSAHFKGCKVVVLLMRQLLSSTHLFYLHWLCFANEIYPDFHSPLLICDVRAGDLSLHFDFRPLRKIVLSLHSK